ncbi:MAG: flagellar protein FlgJ [Candidatus Frackibacter sp. T328-2]|nr:MAG: flagellar protein FlgJ [Candidatus Frackibacter sp. T328-2]
MKIASNQHLNLLQAEGQIQKDKQQASEFKELVNNLQESSTDLDKVTDSDKVQEAKLKEVTQKFSQLFVNLMLKEMRKTVPESSYLDGGLQEDIFRERLDREYVKGISNSGQLDLAKKLYEQLSRKK